MKGKNCGEGKYAVEVSRTIGWAMDKCQKNQRQLVQLPTVVLFLLQCTNAK